MPHNATQPSSKASVPSGPSAAETAERAVGTGQQRLWPAWVLLGVLLFAATQLTVLAFALQGKWFVLVGPAVVCAVKAWGTWEWIRPRLHAPDDASV